MSVLSCLHAFNYIQHEELDGVTQKHLFTLL